jgi:hypothetical protein
MNSMEPKRDLQPVANPSRWAFLPAFAGVGLQTNLRERRKGLRPWMAGAVGELAIAGITLWRVPAASRGLGFVQEKEKKGGSSQ